MNKLLLAVATTFYSFFCFSQAQLVKDINSTPSSITPYDHELMRSGNLVYFPINDGHGNELWSTDGTQSGTKRITDLNPGGGDGLTGAFAAFQNKMFFSGSNGVSGAELWATDGTEAGTILVMDIFNGGNSSYPSNFSEFNSKLYFLANDGESGRQLWSTDGTTDGTQTFFNPTSIIGSNTFHQLIAGTDNFYFTTSTFNASTGAHPGQLWKSDGTSVGTTMVKEFTSLHLHAVIGSIAYFSADDGTGPGIWRTNGIADGTYKIENYYGDSFMEYHGNVIYSAAGAIFITDGTTPNSSTYLLSKPLYASAVVNDTVYIITDNSIVKTDGTYIGTHKVADIGYAAENISFSQPLPILNNKILLSYNPGSTDYDLQGEAGVFDLSSMTVSLIKDIHAGAGGSRPTSWVSLGDKMVFLADDGVHGFALWETDGTAAGTTFVADPLPGTESAMINDPAVINDRLYFVASSKDPNSFELWTSQGTEATTTIFNHSFLFPRYLGNLSSDAYIYDLGRLLKINTITDSLEVISDLSSNIYSVGWWNGVNPISNGKLFYNLGVFGTSDYPLTGNELWVTDGTPNGSHIVKDINPGEASSISYTSGADLNSQLLFGADDGTSGTELWISDGTESGTKLLKDINATSASSYPNGFCKLGDILIFSAGTDVSGRELWKTDGTTDGTGMIKDIKSGASDSSPAQFVVLNNQVFFIANDDSHHAALWKTDGTEAGTVFVKSLTNGIQYLSVAGSLLYLSANDGIHGQELWVSDGTDSGTTLIDLLPGAASSNPTNFFNAGGICYFIADNKTWKTAGSAETTSMVSDLLPTTSFAYLNNAVYFGANSEDYGNELFKIQGKIVQQISFEDFPTKKLTDPDFEIVASSTSGLTLSFTISDTTIVKLVAGKLKILAVGTVTITATQAGNDIYEAASPVSKQLVIDQVMGLNEEQEIKLYPIPSSKSITINFPEYSGSATVSIRSISGSEVLFTETSNKEINVDLANLVEGVYLAKLSFGSQTKIVKIVKI